MSIINQIEEVEQRAKECQDKLDEIETQLRLDDVGDIRRRTLQKNREKIEGDLAHHENDLTKLRSENRKTMFVSCAVLALVLAIFYWFTGFELRSQTTDI